MEYTLKLKCKAKGIDWEITQEEYQKQLDNPNFIKSFNANKPNMVGVLVDEKNVLHEIVISL